MKFFQIEYIISALGSSIIAIFSMLFYFDLTMGVEASKSEIVGSITFKREKAQRKYESQVVWTDVEKNSIIRNNDTIRTADFSEAVIKLNDDTEIILDERSMILVAVAKDRIEIDFSKGSITARRNNIMDRAVKKLNIKSKKIKITIGKSNVNLSQKKGRDLSFTVNKGDATINTDSGIKVIKKNQKALLGDGNITVYKLNLKLVKPAPHEYFINSFKKKKIFFSWEVVKGPYDIFLDISGDNSFNTISMTIKVSQDPVKLVLLNGIYYWRLRARHRITKKTEISEIRRFSILWDEPLQLISPQNRAVVTYNKTLPIINFKWVGSTIPSTYRLILSNDRKMKNIFQTIQIPGNSIGIDTLQKGKYFWKVTKDINVRGNLHSTTSEVHMLVIDKKKLLDSPRLIYPPDNKVINLLSLRRKPLTFTWQKSSEIPLSKLTIGRDKDFLDIINTFSSTVNFIHFNERLQEGLYYWRVSGIMEKGVMISPSEVRRFRLIKSDVIKLIEPENNSEIRLVDDEKNLTSIFSWERTDIGGIFHLQISKDSKFLKLYKKIMLEEFSQQVNDLSPGKYFWRVKLLDDSGSILMKSNTFSFKVNKRLGIPSAIKPSHGDVIDMTKKGALNFSWKRLKDANYYELRLFQMHGNKPRRIIVKKTVETSYEMDELEKLDVGRFYWTLQAFEKVGEMDRKTGRSPKIKMDFELKLSSFNKKPIIELPEVIYLE